MTEAIELSCRLFSRYIDMHAFVMRRSLEAAETINNGLFAVCKTVLRNSEESSWWKA